MTVAVHLKCTVVVQNGTIQFTVVRSEGVPIWFFQNKMYQ